MHQDVGFPASEEWLDQVSLYQGDITKLAVGAIVNAANRALLGGGGALDFCPVDGQIHRAAGSGLLKECRTLGGVKTGEAKITKGHKLPAMHIIHAVGPIYDPDAADLVEEQLQSWYKVSLDMGVDNSVGSIVFCSISTGIYGYPIADATHVALRTMCEYLDAGKADPTKLQKVVFCVWSDKDWGVYRQLVPLYFPPSATDKDKDKEEVVNAVVDALVQADVGGVSGDAGGGSGDAGGGGDSGGGGGGD